MRKVDELIYVYEDLPETVCKNILENSCKTISKGGKYLIKKRVKDSILKKEYYDLAHDTIEFENGSSLTFVILEKNSSSFDIAHITRESFIDILKESQAISYTINLLSKRHQTFLIELLSFFEVTAKWERPLFKKRSVSKPHLEIPSGFYTDIEDDKISSLIDKGRILGEANNMARELCALPANILSCSNYKKRIKKEYSLINSPQTKIKFYSYDDLRRMKAGAFCAVAQGDINNDAFIVKMSYRPKTKTKKKISLIGKGIVFDSGGLNLKYEGMDGMHRDMTGSAVALATFSSLVKRGVNCNIDCYLAIAENKVSHMSYRQGDIIRALNGDYIEITNTDAEGRLVMADAITLAKRGRPNLIIDFATLTGVAIDALDGVMAAVFSNDEKISSLAKECGEITSERVWDFPIIKDVKRALRIDTMADIRQTDPSRDCDHIIGAAFLENFYEKSKFLHIDLSCEFCDHGLGIIDTKETGFGVMLANKIVDKFK